MFNDLSVSLNETNVDYAISNSSLPFAQYIAHSRTLIEDRRTDLQHPPGGADADRVIEANCPFEFYPPNPIHAGKQLKYGALLIHGLLDCPFSLRDVGTNLQANGILVRSVLLPGHGTKPSDLINVSYHDWIQAVRYGVESLSKEVEHIYLIGYSTGAALSIYHALHDSKIAGIILISPAIRLKAPVDIFIKLHQLLKPFNRQNKSWLYREKENDYTKYHSIALNAVSQVNLLTKVIAELRQHHTLHCPMFMISSREDETISSSRALDYFSHFKDPDSKLLLYSSLTHGHPDSRISTRLSCYPDLHVKHFSHAAVPFAPDNFHYGENGDYPGASHLRLNGQYIFGAYNKVEINFFEMLRKCGLGKQHRRELTYNPDFDFMAESIVEFVLK